MIAQLGRLRPAFSRNAPFFWFSIFVIGLCLTNDTLGGITPAVRGLSLGETSFYAMRHMLHSSAVNFNRLVELWAKSCNVIFAKDIVKINGRQAFIADAIKTPKEGRRMPGVKKLHQESSNNSKPKFIRGHFFQVVGALVHGVGNYFCIPLVGRIQDGFKIEQDDERSLQDKFAESLLELAFLRGGILIADAWYACCQVINRLPPDFGLAIITRVAKNAVAYALPTPDFVTPAKRGKKPTYGKHIKLMSIFDDLSNQKIGQLIDSFGNSTDVTYWCADLLWKPLHKMVRFVGCNHPEKGKIILLCTDLAIEALTVIQGYTFRMRIEISFKVAVHTVHAWGYRLWSKTIDKLTRFPKTENLSQKPSEYVAAYMLKIKAYEVFVLAGFISQGILAYLSIHHGELVKSKLKSWFRTIRPNISVSENVVAEALKNSRHELSQSIDGASGLRKFIFDQIERHRSTEKKVTPNHKIATG